MAQLPIDEALNRFKDNEDRFNKFVNDDAGYTSSAGENVESVPAFLERIESEISATGAIAITEANKVAAQAAQAAAESAEATAEAARDTALTHATAAEDAKDTAVAIAAGFGAGLIGKATKALLDADLAHAADAIAYVTNDTTATNNGFYRKVGASGSGSWAKGDDSWIDALNSVGSFATVPHDTTINVDMTAKTITGGGGVIVHSKGYKTIPTGQNVAFDYTTATYLMWLYINRSTGAFGIVSTPALPPIGSAVVGFIYNERFYGNDPASRVRVVPTIYTRGFNGGRDFLATYHGPQITVNLQTKTISVTGTGYCNYRGTAVVTNTQSVVWPFAGTFGFLAVNPVNGAFIASDSSTTPPSGWPIIGFNLLGKFYTNSPVDNIRFIDADGKDAPNFGLWDSLEPTAIVANDCNITINLQAKTVSIGSTGALICRGNYVYPNNPQNVSFTHTNPNYLLYVYVNKGTKVVGAVEAPNRVPSNCYIIATVYNQKVHANDPYGRITLYDSNGNIVYNESKTTFDQNRHRMILPDEMYFLPNTPLALFKSPCFADFSQVVSEEIKMWLDTKGSDISERFQYIDGRIKLEPSQLGANFEIGYRHNSAPDKRYIKSIARNVASAGALNGRSLNMLVFGDSLTEVGMASAFKTAIEAQGATVTPIGTYFSSYTNNLRGEGRGYWNYRSFIGKDNYSEGVGAHTRSNGGKTDTAKFENPFLKLADATDIANHPDWCFRFTGVQRELSYTEDANKAGNFYIFDFAWYRAQHSVPVPDFITIALSTNDVNLDRSVYTQAERLQYMRLGLEIMIKQIKADLPNVKIGIIPAPAWSSTSTGDQRWYDETSTWVENCITDVKALSATYNNLYIVPVWPFMSEDFAFDYSSSVDLSSINTTKVKTITDWVHFGDTGRLQYANVVAAWTANEV